VSTTGNVGFYGTTPIAKQTATGQTAGYVTGVGTAVLADGTFTGGVGATAYTLGDIVKALKNLGLITQ
jgi:hypothetical protein